MAPLQFFATLARFDKPFYESGVRDRFEHLDLSEFYDFIDKSAYRGVTYRKSYEQKVNNGLKRNEDPGHSDIPSGGDIMYRQRHFVADSTRQWTSARRDQTMGGVKLSLWFLGDHKPSFYMFREVAAIGEGLDAVYLREIRSSVRLTMRAFHQNFHILVLDDFEGSITTARNGNPYTMALADFKGQKGHLRQGGHPRLLHESTVAARWNSLGLKPCGAGTGVTQFACEIWRIFEKSALGWEQALNRLDNVCTVQVSYYKAPRVSLLDL